MSLNSGEIRNGEHQIPNVPFTGMVSKDIRQEHKESQAEMEEGGNASPWSNEPCKHGQKCLFLEIGECKFNHTLSQPSQYPRFKTKRECLYGERWVIPDYVIKHQRKTVIFFMV
jgi:hypothetical protein